MNREMRTTNRSLLLALTILGGFAIAGAPALIYVTADIARAAETTTTKKKKKVTTNYNQPRPKKKDYYGYPEEPNQAGMSDYCSYMYNIYHRRGVGCNQYGHDFMFND
jgi:hypothetical protein